MLFKKTSNVVMNVISFSEALSLPVRFTTSMDTFVKAPYFSGKGSLNFTCGKCKFNLMKNTEREQLNNIAFQCPNCNIYNSL